MGACTIFKERYRRKNICEGGLMMAKLKCSLCGNVKEAEPLDMDDIVFGTYVKAMRRFGLSKSKGGLGICSSCMENYKKIAQNFQGKLMTYGFLAILFSVVYFYLTNNVLVSVLVALILFSFSLFSYCPPLKRKEE